MTDTLKMENKGILEATRRASISYPDRKIILEIILSESPLIHEGEIIASYERSQDKRKNSELTIVMDRRAKDSISLDGIIKRVFQALDNGDFKQVKKGKSIFCLKYKRR